MAKKIDRSKTYNHTLHQIDVVNPPQDAHSCIKSDSLEAILNCIDCAILVFNDKYEITQLNESAKKLFGVEETENIFNLSRKIDRVEILEQIKRNFQIQKKLEKFVKIEKTPYGLKLLHFQDGSEKNYGILYFYDISKLIGEEDYLHERKDQMTEMAAKQKAILDNAISAVCLIDRDGNVLAVNKAWETFFSENLEAELNLKIKFKMSDKIRKILDGEIPVFKFEYPNHLPNQQRWFLCTITPVRDGRNKPVGAVITQDDISERKFREEVLVREKMQTMEQNERRTLFLANLSHELKTPLNAIIGFSDLLLEKLKDQERDADFIQYTQSLNEGARHLDSIVKRILDMAKIQSGTFVLKEEIVSPRELFEKAITIIKPTYSSRTIRFEMLDELSQFQLRCDKNLIIEVLINIIINSLKYSPSSTEVLVKVIQSKTREWIFKIIDKGHGMDEKEIEVALEPFGQNIRHKPDQASGLGLGLPFSAYVAEIHGGILKIISQWGVGTTVEIRFPNSRTYFQSKEVGKLNEKKNFSR